MELSEVEMLVAELETRIDRLRALYEQYFLGFEKTEPLVVRKDVERRFDKLRKSAFRNTALRFRFSMMQQRYSTLSSYWMRICRQMEEGTYKRHLLRAKARFGDVNAPASDDAPPAATHDGYEIDVDMEDDTADAVAEFGAEFGRIAAVAAPVSAKTVALRAPPGPPPPSSSRSTMEMLREEARLLEMLDTDDAPPSSSIARPRLAPLLVLSTSAVATQVATQAGSRAAPPVAIQPQSTLPRPLPSAFRPMSSNAAGVPMQSAPGPIAQPTPPVRSSGLRPNAPAALASANPPRSPISTAEPPPVAGGAGLSDARVRDLYAKYIDAKREKQESTAQLTYETVARSLRDSSAKLSEKHGGKNIDFEVAEKDGKVILRPVLKR